MAEAKFTTDHDEIREWAEARGGRLAAVRKTHGKDDPGIIRIEFPDAPNAKDSALKRLLGRNSSRSSMKPISRLSTRKRLPAVRRAISIS